ncbi:MAG: YIP1 family protein [candidate division WOR-3 bacterium]
MMSVINVIIEPQKVFEHIKEKDDWWIPFIIVILISFLFLWISSPAVNRLLAEKMAEVGVSKEFSKAAEIIKYIVVPITSFIGFLILSLIIWLLGNLFGGDWDFVKALDLYAYSSITQVLRTLLNIITILIRGTPNIVTLKDLNVATGLNLFFNPQNPKLYALFSGIEAFTIWQFTLISFGVSQVSGVSKKKGVWVGVISYIISLGFSVIFAKKEIM